MGLPVWCTDQAGPFQTMPYAGQSWRPEGKPARQPHEYLRDGTAKILTLFRPADGKVRLAGVTTCTNAVLHPWLKRELTAILAPRCPSPPAKAATIEASRRPEPPGSDGRKLTSSRHPQRIAAAAGMPLVLTTWPATRRPVTGLWLFRSRHHALIYPAGWVVAEHGREHPADPQAAGPGRSASRDPARLSAGPRRWRGTGMRTRRRSSGVGSGWSGVGGSESDVTGSAGRERARGGRSGDGRGRPMATGEANDPLVPHPPLIRGYNRFNFVRASSILNCQSTARCLALVFSAQIPISV